MNRHCAKGCRCAGQNGRSISPAVDAFRLNAAVADNDTQIHTHMCYCEFNDIMDSIAALDADVITIETSRSDMELLEAFEDFDYPNEIGRVFMIFTRRMCRKWSGLKPCCAKRRIRLRWSVCGLTRLRPENTRLG